MTGLCAITPAQHGRLKRAARACVEACGGVDGASATTTRGRSTCGRWMALNEADLPPIDAALAMDEIAVARGEAPPMTEAMAAATGHALLRLPDAMAAGVDWMGALGALSAETGQAVQAFCRAMDDQKMTAREAGRLRRELRDVLRSVMALDAPLAAIEEGQK